MQSRGGTQGMRRGDKDRAGGGGRLRDEESVEHVEAEE